MKKLLILFVCMLFMSCSLNEKVQDTIGTESNLSKFQKGKDNNLTYTAISKDGESNLGDINFPEWISGQWTYKGNYMYTLNDGWSDFKARNISTEFSILFDIESDFRTTIGMFSQFNPINKGIKDNYYWVRLKTDDSKYVDMIFIKGGFNHNDSTEIRIEDESNSLLESTLPTVIDEVPIANKNQVLLYIEYSSEGNYPNTGMYRDSAGEEPKRGIRFILDKAD